MGIRARIKELEKDLTEEIVIKPEDDTIHPNPENPCAPWIYPHSHVETIANPNVTIREAAARELQQIYDNSKWYQVLIRKKIAKILGIQNVGKGRFIEEEQGDSQYPGDGISDYRGNISFRG